MSSSALPSADRDNGRRIGTDADGSEHQGPGVACRAKTTLMDGVRDLEHDHGRTILREQRRGIQGIAAVVACADHGDDPSPTRVTKSR